jgi:hypothetical protein
MAFHLGFADIIALLQQLTFQEALLETIQRTVGPLYSASLQPDRNKLISLGQQFGQALGMGDELRSAVGTPPKKDALQEREPYQRGAIMKNAVFEAFLYVYLRRTSGLFRLWAMPSDMGHPDLTRRLAADASHIATTFLQLCIRAIAYCPAVDITLGDYLRAMMTVHARLDPDDHDGLRDALIDAFASRGIYPPDVGSMSESELVWRDPGESLELSRDVVRALRDADAAGRKNADAEKGLKAFCEEHRAALGFVNGVPLDISPFHQAVRFVGPELDVAEELVCQVTQTVERKVGRARSAGFAKLVGGTTLVFGDDGRTARLRYAITKRIDARRQRSQIAWQNEERQGWQNG